MMYLGDKAVGIATLKELDGFFEVVHRFTPTEDEARHTMPNYGPGLYIFCEDPILTVSKANNDGYPNNSLVAGVFSIYSTITAPKPGSSLTALTNGKYDFWGTYATATETTITFGTSSSNAGIGFFLSNHNYIVFKTILNEQEVTPNA